MTAVPLIKLYDTLLVPLGEELTDTEVIALRERLAERLRRQNLRSLVIEVSSVTIFDSFVARAVAALSGVASLLGVRAVLVGLSPAIAITLTEMGIELPGVETTLDLDSALQLLGIHDDSRNPVGSSGLEEPASSRDDPLDLVFD
jgi:rsbT antagonist protein RsbS